MFDTFSTSAATTRQTPPTSSRTVADQAGYELQAFHIPKTVDNDLLVTDHCPGYGTAATFVALALMGDDLDNRALPGVKIDVIMGRNAGFLTAASALGRKRDNDGPHLVYVPERPVSLDKFLSDVESVVKRIGRCVVAVSEGICDTDGVTWAEKLARRQRNGCTRQYPTFRHGRSGGLSGSAGERQTQNQARPGRHLRLPAKKLPWLAICCRCA